MERRRSARTLTVPRFCGALARYDGAAGRTLCPMSSPAPGSIATALNTDCHCIVVDEALLSAALAKHESQLCVKDLQQSHPHLFSRTGVFVDATALATMRAVIKAIERVIALPSYRALALSDAPEHAHIASQAAGAFLGYDFHLSDAGPQLIEINTNPGGALLSATLQSAQVACCEEVATTFRVGQTDPTQSFIAMFRAEYALARGDLPLKRVAIVDHQPATQYLYPEFVLFARLFAAHGISAQICDPADLSIQNGRLTLQGEPLDLVYNRLTDFSLQAPEHAVLAQAWREDLTVITPHPRAHALYADKRRLVTLSDQTALAALGVAPDDVALLLRHVPRTLVVTEALRDELWAQRKGLFFKPQSGYGSKATYRGDKITKGVFESVLQAPYVAQSLVAPSSRSIRIRDEKRELKLDIRNYAYQGEVQLVAARLYQGQTTNFRTEGGGFSPVYETAT